MSLKDFLTENDAHSRQYPVALKAVQDDAKAPRAAANFLQACYDIIQAYADGEVINTKYDTIKASVNRFVSTAFEQLVSKPFLWAGAYKDQADDIQDLNLPDSARLLPGYLKKLEKLLAATKETEMYKVSHALALELMSLSEADAWLKAHTVMASDKRKAAAAAKDDEKEQYNKKLTSNTDVKKVIALLKDTATGVERDIYEAQLKGLVRIIERYKKDVAEKNETDYNKLYAMQPYERHAIRLVTKRDYSNGNHRVYVYTLKADYLASLEAEAKKIAAEIVDHFVHKNAGKLSFVLYTKNNMESAKIENVKLSRGAVECDVVCKFKDGSGFTANTSVVYAISKLGNWFYRYPTLFRAVKLPDGTMMSAPTEQKMDEVFAITK